MHIISLDPGFGDCKVALFTDISQKPEYFKHINVVAHLGKDQSTDVNADVVELDGEFYMIGLPASQATASQVMPINDYESLKKVTPLILKRYLQQYDDITTIVVSLSLAFQKFAGDYKDFLIKTLGLDGKSLFLVPQGVGCKIALDKVGFNIEDPSFKIPCKNYLGVDIGFNTIDVIKVIDGVLIKKNIQGYSDMGVTQILGLLREDLKDMGCKEELSDAKIKVFLSQGSAVVRGVQYDLRTKITQRVKEYVEVIHEFLEKNYSEDLNSIDFLVLFGGGANLVGNNKEVWEKYYSPQFVKIPVTPEFYNAIGGLYFPSLQN